MGAAGGESTGGGAAVPVDPDLGTGPPRAARRRRGGGIPVELVVALGCGGALGAVARYAVARGIPTEAGRFPWDTFAVNLSGSLVLGFLLVFVVERVPRDRWARPVVGTGIIGAYTTFSTFTVEAVELVRHGDPAVAAVYVATSLVAGLLVAWAGMTAARAVAGAGRRGTGGAR